MSAHKLAALLASSLVLGACALNPATGKKQLSLYGETDEVSRSKSIARCSASRSARSFP